jgi:cytochrome c peroxidase
MTPEQIREQNAFPKGFYPLPHPKHSAGGFVFPQFVIDEINRQEGRDLTRFDVEYDIPDHFLPEFPPPMYLNQRKPKRERRARSSHAAAEPQSTHSIKMAANSPFEFRWQRDADLCDREPLSTSQTRFAVTGIAEAL